MSHRKFSAPRHGSLAFSPRTRSRTHQGRIKAFPKDNANDAPHLTAFIGYKAGMTHVQRDVQRVGSRLHNKETVEAVTILEAPPMVVCGVVGYVQTPSGLRTFKTVFSQHLDESVKRRFYKNWYRVKGMAFDRYAVKKYAPHTDKKGNTVTAAEQDLAKIAKYCQVVRILAHTQPRRMGFGLKKANLVEIQINGGTPAQKVEFARPLFEKEVPVDSVFRQDEMVDLIGVTRGKGFAGVISRFGVTGLPRKTHRGLRKVACIGAWHPARVNRTVARAGQKGYFHRTELNKKIYRIGKAARPFFHSRKEASTLPANFKAVTNYNATTESDLTLKTITPMGGFKKYGVVNQDFVMIKGSVMGPVKRVITLRKAITPVQRRIAFEPAGLKFIDTSSKTGKRNWQTSEEKARIMA